LMLALNLGCFFAVAMVCHGALATTRPQISRLTEFYFFISLGGVLGGLFNAILAPMLFSSVWEFPLVLVLACLLIPGSRTHHWSTLGRDLLLPAMLFVFLFVSHKAPAPHWHPISVTAALFVVYLSAALLLMSFRKRPLRFALGIAASLAVPAATTSGETLATYRSFFGVYRVSISDDGFARILTHGTTVHGAESLAPGEEALPTFYYSREGPFGRFFAALDNREIRRVGVVGLGTGELGCYAKPTQQWTFYEIDPLVERIARDGRFFHFTTRCGDNPHIVLGDARLTLADAPNGLYDALVIDAFSSDSIPMHLLTREALTLYFSKLTTGGVVLFHISNRYLDLEPVVAALAYSSGVEARYLLYLPSSGTPLWRSSAAEVVAVVTPGADLDFLTPDAGWAIPAQPPSYALWTDQKSDLLRTIRWFH
jgi:spermidine synthase